MVNRHMKRQPISVIREIQIKITRKYHFTPISMDIIKKTRDNKYWQGCGEKERFVHFWWECELVQPLWKIVS